MVKKLLFLFAILIYSTNFSQEKSVNNLDASPNPFSNSTNISFNSLNKESVIIVVKNILGKTVFKKEFETVKGNNSIPFYSNNLQPGMYIYSIQNNTDFIHKRFIIK